MGFSDLAATAIYLFMISRVSMIQSYNIMFMIMAIASTGLVIVLGVSKAEE